MTFISYAQNCEDVMLWRALKDIEKGFYIDAGAWSPDVESVTRAFYERGWRGINIEPNPEFHRELQEKRVHDINLCLAIGEVSGTAEMNFFGNTGLSTLDDGIAQEHVQAGWELERRTVDTKTLGEIWEQHVPDGHEVHFLKIDVEGFEEQAIRGNNWKRYRPWIVAVESTLPLTQTESHQSWEPVLRAAGYRFAYADGLNRFYVAKEHKELLPFLKNPPNVFDQFIRADHAEAANKAARLESSLAAERDGSKQLESDLRSEREQHEKLQSELTSQRESIASLEAALAAERDGRKQLESELAAERKSSKQLASDLRSEREQHEKLQSELASQRESVASLETRLTAERDGRKHLAEELQSKSARVHALERSLSWKITAPLRLGLDTIKWPWLNEKLKELAQAQGLEPVETTVPDVNSLTPHARKIYFDLKKAIASQEK